MAVLEMDRIRIVLILEILCILSMASSVPELKEFIEGQDLQNFTTSDQEMIKEKIKNIYHQEKDRFQNAKSRLKRFKEFGSNQYDSHVTDPDVTVSNDAKSDQNKTDVPYIDKIEKYYIGTHLSKNLTPTLNDKKSATKMDDKLFAKFIRIKKEYDYQNDLLSKIELELKHSLPKSGESANKMTIESPAIFKEPVEARHIHGQISKSAILSFDQALLSLTKNVQIIQNTLHSTMEYLIDVVPKTGSNKLVTGIKHFYGPKTVIKDLSVTYSNIGNVSSDEASIDSTIQNLVRIDDERQIKGRKIFEGEMSARDLRTSTLNRRNTSYYMTTEEPARIKKAKYVKGISVQNDVTLYPNSKVDGIDISEDAVKQYGNYDLGSCHFKHLNALIGINVEEDNVNGRSFSNFVGSLFRNGANLTIDGPVSFKKLDLRKDLKANSLMGVNLKQFVNNLALKLSGENLHNIDFKSPVKCANLNANKINNEKFPDEFVTRAQPWVDFGSKSFGNVHFHQLTVRGYVDQIRTADLVTKTTPQDILGLKTFEKGIQVLGDLNINSNIIDGVDVSHLFLEPNNAQSKKIVVFEEGVSAPAVTVKGKVNEITLEDIAQDLIFKEDREVVVSGRKIFLNNLNVKNKATARKINGNDFDNFVNIKTNNIITAKKVFSNHPNMRNLHVKGFVDNTNFTDLMENSVFVNKPHQIITGSKQFRGLTSQILNIKRSINQNYLDNLLTKFSDQDLPFDIHMKKADFNIVKAQNVSLESDGLVNGLNFPQVKQKCDRELVLDENLIVEGSATIKNAKFYRINDHKLTDLEDHLLKNNGIQILENDIVFDFLEVEGSIDTGLLTTGNALLLKQKATTALRADSMNFIEDIYWDDVEIDKITAAGLINGINLRDLESDLIYLDDANSFSIKGLKHFLNGFDVMGDVVTNSVNGRNLSNIFSRTTRQDIDSSVTFRDLETNNIFLKTFNSLNLRKLIIAAREREKSVIVVRGPVKFDGHVRISSLEFGANVAGYDLRSVLEDAIEIPEKGGKVVITGKKRFLQTTTFSDLNIGNLNGMPNIRKIREEILRNHTLNYLYVNGKISTRSFQANNIISKNKSDFFSPKFIREHFVLASEKMAEPLKFESVAIDGNLHAKTINGLRLPDDFLIRNSDQDIQRSLQVGNVITKDVFINGRINGYKLPSGKDLNKKEYIKVLSGYTLYNESQHLKGNLVVKGKVGHRGLNIPDDLVFLNKANTIKGLMTFTAPITLSILHLQNQKLNGMDLSTLDKSLEYIRNMFEEHQPQSKDKDNLNRQILTMKNIYNKECKKTATLQNALKSTYEEPHYLELSSLQLFKNTSQDLFKDELKQNAKISSVLSFKIGKNIWMVDSVHYGHCETKVLRWNEKSKEFEPEYSLDESGNIQQWIEIDSTEDTVYLLAVIPGVNECASRGSSLWKASITSFKLEKIQNFEAANKVFIERFSQSIFVYFDIGYQNLRYEFNGGLLLHKSPVENIPLSKTITKLDGGNLWVKIWDKNLVGILDSGNERVVTMPPDIEDLVLFNHLGNTYFVFCQRKITMRKSHFIYEVFVYKNLNVPHLFSMGILDIGSPVKIIPFSISDDDSNSTFITALYENGTPKIFRFGGKGTKLWAELPITLKTSNFAFDFKDYNNNVYITFGDDEKIITTRLHMNGRKYEKELIKC